MKIVKPIVLKIAETAIDYKAIKEGLEQLGFTEFAKKFPRAESAAQNLIEFAGRICYESFEPGTLNPNITKIREDPYNYFENIIKKGDGSIFEHATVSFLFLNVSRVFTHELCRHRVGTAISQESLRYVRPKELKMWLPPDLDGDILMGLMRETEHSEKMFKFLEEGIDWKSMDFNRKKVLTSALRRMFPEGMATHVIWTANHRTLRHVIEQRTDPAAEVEIRYVFDKVAQIVTQDYPALYQDAVRTELSDGTGSWRFHLRAKI